MANFVDSTLADIRKRMRELESAIEEYAQLQEAEAALKKLATGAGRRTRSAAAGVRRRATSAGRPTRNGATTKSRPASAKRAAVGRKPAGSGQRGRPKGSGKRQAQAVRIVGANPGITTGEIAKKMGIKPNYLYRVLPDLQKDGKLKKDGRGWVKA